MVGLDPRRNAFRPDLAAEALRGQVEAARFVAPTRRRVIRPALGLRAAPGAKGLVAELVYGQLADVYETRDGLCWLQAARDGYVGYGAAAGLGPEGPPATHRVAQPFATLYPAPDIKTAPRAALPMGAELSGRAEGDFLATDDGFAPLRQLAPLGAPIRENDFVAVAEMFLHAPYLWGGGTALGLDCSGLVQAALHMTGVDCPRDSDMQAREIGAPLADDAPLRRGDLIFWRGHAGIMRDSRTLLHANGHRMAVTSEPLAKAIARIAAAEFGEVIARRRP